ncbi:MAG: flavin-containing monooxygenase, partial [Acidimicrobiales bacterium]
FTLGYSFRPWDQREAIADGASILRYIEDTASATGVDKHIRLGRRVVSAEWSSEESRWKLTVKRADTGGVEELTCAFLFACTGYYRYDHGYQPDFVDMDRFAGTIVHPQGWPADLDYTDKRVVVIGSGATAVTLVPALAQKAAHVTMLQRSPSYVGSVPTRNGLDALLLRILPKRYARSAVRWMHALFMQGFYQLSRRRPELVKRMVRSLVRRQLPPGYDVETHFTPRYNPWDERFCAAPDGDLFRAISSGAASVVTDHVDRFTDTGLLLRSGASLETDIVVTATGLELLFLGGMDLTVDGERVDVSSKLVYKGMMLEGVPNLAVAVGYTNASWTLKCDLTCDYVCRLLEHMRLEGHLSCTPVNSGVSPVAQSVLGLSSGYIRRAAHKFPKQGSEFPWRVYQSYLRDYRALKRHSVVDRDMVFSGHGDVVQDAVPEPLERRSA